MTVLGERGSPFNKRPSRQSKNQLNSLNKNAFFYLTVI